LRPPPHEWRDIITDVRSLPPASTR